jgi:hypothetical protein
MVKRPRNVEFSKSTRKNKKYRVDFDYDGEHYSIHFGQLPYQHYKDSTPLKLYSRLDHKDPARRKNYYSRHGPENDPRSAKYWAHRYLW